MLNSVRNLMVTMLITSLPLLSHSADSKQWWSATENEIRNAPCLPSVPDTKEEIRELLRTRSIGIREIYNVLSLEELQDVATAVMSLPTTFFSSSDPVNFHYRADLDAVADASVTVGRQWQNLSSEMRIYSIVHEIGHQIGDASNGIQNSKKWQNIETSWNIVATMGPAKFGRPIDPSFSVSKYALRGPHEDWAESFSSYRFSPEHLRNTSQKKYDLLKSLYGNIEYLDEKSCRVQATYGLSKSATNQLKGLILNNQRILKKSQKECGPLSVEKKAECTLKTFFTILDEKRFEEIWDFYRELGYESYAFDLWLKAPTDTGKFEMLENLNLSF